MARVFVAVEGETEETFVNEVLSPHLLGFGHHGNARLRERRGGIQGWSAVVSDFVRHRVLPEIEMTPFAIHRIVNGPTLEAGSLLKVDRDMKLTVFNRTGGCDPRQGKTKARSEKLFRSHSEKDEEPPAEASTISNSNAEPGPL